MNIVIVEDERLTAEDLSDIIKEVNPQVTIQKILSSVKDAVSYFRSNPLPDLIFSDIQLGDGLSFEIYKQVHIKVPIIFCTAYDDYALNAFKANGIHYILKPFDENAIVEAFEKFQQLKSVFSINEQSLEKVLEALNVQTRDELPSSLLVYQQDKVIPIKFDDIALFFIKNNVSHLKTFNGKTYYVNKSLDEIQQLTGDGFYRANRQFVLNRNVIKEVRYTNSRKVEILLNIDFDNTILVSKEKMTDFLNWLGA
ncbi:MAG: LytR/AlgR family response regulator transcription factor [Niabella sp.]